MKFETNQQVFFALVRSGLWEQEVSLLSYKKIDFKEVYQIAEEQSVVGLVAAGLEHVSDYKVPQEIALQFASTALQLEKRNISMNEFVAQLFKKLREKDIYALLVKGQGIAQCYERPLWRSSGDVDLLLNIDNYEKAKALLVPIADHTETELAIFKHYGMTVKGYEIELHGTLCPRLTKHIDKVVDEIQTQTFRFGEIRVWNNNGTDVFIPGIDSDTIFQITHILKHFYQGGVGLRQICDLSRFLWKYNKTLNLSLLEKRIEYMGIMEEWKVFAAFMVDFLGAPAISIPFYSPDKYLKKKAEKICSFVLEVGNFGHKRNNIQIKKWPYFICKFFSLLRRTTDCIGHFFIFPLNSLRIWLHLLSTGVSVVIHNK